MKNPIKEIGKKKQEIAKLPANFYKIGTKLEVIAEKIRKQKAGEKEAIEVEEIAKKCKDFASLKKVAVFRAIPILWSIPKAFRAAGKKFEGVALAIRENRAGEEEAVALCEEADGFKKIAEKVWGMKP